MTKMTKEIKKLMTEKAEINKLEEIKISSEKILIFTNEMQYLEESYSKC